MSSRINLVQNVLSSNMQKITSKPVSTSYRTKALPCDVFEKQNNIPKEFCPDNSPFSALRELLRKHILESSGIIEDHDTDYKRVIDSISLHKDPPPTDKITEKLSELGVSCPTRRHPNLITGGKISSLSKKESIAKELKNARVDTIAYFKDLDCEQYEKFAKEHGFNFIKLPNVILDLCLSSDDDLVKTNADFDFIADDFKNFMINLASTIKNSKTYAGCEFGTCRTDSIMYYLSALIDGIDTSSIKTTDSMVKNFNFLKSFKTLI